MGNTSIIPEEERVKRVHSEGRRMYKLTAKDQENKIRLMKAISHATT